MVPKLASFILTSARPSIPYLTNLVNCGLQVFQADSGPGSDHIYQIDISLLSLTFNLQVYFLCCLVVIPQGTEGSILDPCYFSSALIKYFISTFTVLYLLLQMTTDLLPTALMGDSYNMTLIYCLTVLDPLYVSTLLNVCIFHLEPTEPLHII